MVMGFTIKDCKSDCFVHIPYELTDELITLIRTATLDEVKEAIQNQHIGENPDGMMRFGALEAIKAIDNLRGNDDD